MKILNNNLSFFSIKLIIVLIIKKVAIIGLGHTYGKSPQWFQI